MHTDVDDLSEQAQATLSRLMPHLHRRPDLPGLSRATLQVQRTARRESTRVQTLVEAVADDPGLSARLLRLSNSAVYASADAGSNESLDRAVRLLGFSAVQQLASGLPLLDRLPQGASARQAREDFLRALLAAQLARELAGDWRDADRAHLSAMFQNLGRLLVATHLGPDAQAIRAAVSRRLWPLSEREQQAALHRLGWTYADLGRHVARHWGWPEALRNTLAGGSEWPTQRPQEAGARQHWLGRLANELADLLVYVAPEQWPAACRWLAQQAQGATGHDDETLLLALTRTQPRLEPLADLAGLAAGEQGHWQAGNVLIGDADPAVLRALEAEAVPDPLPAPAPTAAPAAAPVAAARTAAADAADERVLQQLHGALAARRAVLWRVQPDTSQLALQRVIGEPLSAAAERDWQVDPTNGSDLFSSLCRHGHDSMIHDAHEPRLARHLPAAYRRAVNARSFLVLPLRRQGQAHGLLYLDRQDDKPFKLDGDAMRLVRTLRDQATEALAA